MAKKLFEKEECEYMHYNHIKLNGGDGYALLYITRKWDKQSFENKARLDIYRTLFEIDFKLGTKSEDQLWWCCTAAVNLDIIMVIAINQLYLFILVFSFSKISKSITNTRKKKLVEQFLEHYSTNVGNTTKRITAPERHWIEKNSRNFSST